MKNSFITSGAGLVHIVCFSVKLFELRFNVTVNQPSFNHVMVSGCDGGQA